MQQFDVFNSNWFCNTENHINYEEIVSEQDNSDIVDDVCVDDIIKCNTENMPTVQLIRHQCSVIYFTRILIENTALFKQNEDENDREKLKSICEYLEWMSMTSFIMANKINQKIINYMHEPDKKPHVIRSSYNFCGNNTRCKNFYNCQQITCREHHYVHAIVKHDIDSIISLIKYYLDSNEKMLEEDFNELHRSIKTICFVVRHMVKEISYIDYITKNNAEQSHRNNPYQFGRVIKQEIQRTINEQKPRHIYQKTQEKPKPVKQNRFSCLDIE
jgi:hypothetical protein